MGSQSRSIVWFAALGYAYLLVLIAGLVALVFVLVEFDLNRLVIVPCFILFFVLISFILRIGRPDGHKLARDEAPALVDLVEATAAALQSPRPDEIILTSDINAAVVDLPRFALFGSRRWLIIGLPLLDLLPKDELGAVLAHEFAHLSRRHGRQGLWQARLQIAWSMMAHNAASNMPWVRFLFVPFFRWYEPRLRALIQQQSRAHEFESDHLAAQYTSAAAQARGLLRIALIVEHGRRTALPELLRGSYEMETPPADVMKRWGASLTGYIHNADGSRFMQSILSDATTSDDSHPSYRERIVALDCEPMIANTESALADLVKTSRTQGVQEWLTDAEVRSRIETDIAAEWTAEQGDAWHNLHLAARIGALQSEHTAAESKWARAKWAASCLPAEAAIPLVRAVVTEQPERGAARVALGLLLIEQFQPALVQEGESLLEEVQQHDARYALQAVEALQRHYLRLARSDQLPRLQLRERDLNRRNLNTLRERSGLNYSDVVRQCALPLPQLEHLREALRRYPEVHNAYLVEKKVRYLTATRAYFLAFTADVPWYRSSGGRAQKIVNTLINEIALSTDGDFVVVPMESSTSLERRLRKLPGAAILPEQVEVSSAPLSREWDQPNRLVALFYDYPLLLILVTIFTVIGLLALTDYIFEWS
jgi:Zn-dependent protease with chaperone function